MIIGPASDHHLVSWSLENYIPPSTNDRGRPNDPTYFIFYARGTGDKGEFTFWIEIKVKFGIRSDGIHVQMHIVCLIFIARMD